MNIDSRISDLLDGLKPKIRQVVLARFGLRDGKRQTLQRIGDGLNITRERVRQIEEQAILKLRNRSVETLQDFSDAAVSSLSKTEGVRKEDDFYSDIASYLAVDDKTRHPNRKFFFLFTVLGKPNYERESKDMYSFWYTDEQAKTRLIDYLRSVINHMNMLDRQAVLQDRAYLNEFPDLLNSPFLPISKSFGTNVFGEFGLREWPEVEPKTVRDRVYLVLRQKRSPMHFEQIAKAVKDMGLARRADHAQTVHNELIKDRRFVLVGRGMYALREHGYEPGNVREVIASLLKNKGPLPKEQIVRFVKERRFVKENTILLYLQDKKLFSREKNGHYRLREA